MGGEEFAVLGRAVKTRGQVFARGAYGLRGCKRCRTRRYRRARAALPATDFRPSDCLMRSMHMAAVSW